MQGGPDLRAEPSHDRSRFVLDFAHGLLAERAGKSRPLDTTLMDLARAIGAEIAGIARLPGGEIITQAAAKEGTAKAAWPRQVPPELLAKLAPVPLAHVVPSKENATNLAAVDVRPSGVGRLVWVEAGRNRAWTDGERAALVVATLALGRRADCGDPAPGWARHLSQASRFHRLEDAAHVTRRLSHDFGNVLTGILGFTELSLAQLTPADAAYPFVKELHAAVEHGTRVTDQLRLFSRRSAKSGCSSTVTSILAEEEARQSNAHGTNWTLLIDAAPDLPPVTLNAEALRTILGNVLDNAREAVNNGGEILATARATRLTEADCLDVLGYVKPGTYVEVTVSDDGCGLSSEARQRLFEEPFFTDKPRHRGLGLAVVYGILQAHKGALSIEPRPEGGTVVRLLLPVAAAEAPAASPRCTAMGAARGEKLLIVDDDPMILKLCTTTLEKAGYRVQTAATASEALDSLQAAGAEPFRLVVSDVVMPRMTGVDLAKRLRSGAANVNVLFMSGHVFPSFPKEELAGGPFDFLSKPFRPEGLLSAVRSALDRASQRLPTACAGPG
jgi:signal transduction histidine kinase/CheY-like chemotaxis protein